MISDFENNSFLKYTLGALSVLHSQSFLQSGFHSVEIKSKQKRIYVQTGAQISLQFTFRHPKQPKSNQ